MSNDKSQPPVVLSLTVKDAAKALEFYSEAFDANELFRLPMPDGTLAHAEFSIMGHNFSMSGEYPDWNACALGESETASCLFGLNVENCDDAFKKALAAGATSIQDPTDQMWGWRTGILRDPFGYRWNVRQLLEEVSPEELMKRMQDLMDE